MKNNIWFISACILFFMVGYYLNNSAISLPRYKVAVVNVTEVMEHSSDVKTLKISQEKQMKDLNNLITKAQTEIANETDRNKALKLEADYRQEIETKRSAMDEEYNKKIDDITKNIKNLISKEAQKADYNLVLPTGMVISGGEDITQNVIKEVK